MRTRFRKPSAAKVAVAISTAALFTAAGGPSWAAGFIDGRNIIDDTISNQQIVNDNLDATSLAYNSVGYDELAPGAVGVASQIRSGVVNGGHILDGSIGPADLATGSVSTAKLQDSSVTGAKIMDLAVGNTDLGWNSVTSGKIRDGDVITSDIQDSAVTTSKLSGGSVAKGKLNLTTTTVGFLNNNLSVASGECAEGVAAQLYPPAAGAIPIATVMTGTYAFHFSAVQQGIWPSYPNRYGWFVCNGLSHSLAVGSDMRLTVTWLLP